MRLAGDWSDRLESGAGVGLSRPVPLSTSDPLPRCDASVVIGNPKRRSAQPEWSAELRKAIIAREQRKARVN